jgi:hypothetical protein
MEGSTPIFYVLNFDKCTSHRRFIKAQNDFKLYTGRCADLAILFILSKFCVSWEKSLLFGGNFIQLKIAQSLVAQQV